MKISALGVNTYSNIQNKSKNQVPFKADVRIDDSGFRDYVQDNDIAQIMRAILEEAKTAYENIGSDNMLISVEPLRTDNKKNPWYGFTIKSTFKDVEKGREYILENVQRDFPNRNFSDISQLRERTPNAMDRMKGTCISHTEMYHANEVPSKLPAEFDKMMQSAIKGLTYCIPGPKTD